jgi:hypothetical protein
MHTSAVSLPSWNDGLAKAAILDFVPATTDPSSRNFVPPEDRVATFDQDGTLWVEHPLYNQAMFAIDRVHELAPQHPDWQSQEPFKTRGFAFGIRLTAESSLARLGANQLYPGGVWNTPGGCHGAVYCVL